VISPDDHTAERAALRSVEDVGRATLDELHTMLGVLRDEHESLSVTPAPRLADLPDLCADLGAAPKVELTVQGTPRPLPAGVELSTYRVVQETLTNARRHAGAERVRVTVTYRPSDLLLEIRDDGCGAPVAWEPGHGLLGMRERAVVHGGSLEVDAAPGAGFAVQARLRTEPDL
jgi:signal transduction histidine kinase